MLGKEKTRIIKLSVTLLFCFILLQYKVIGHPGQTDSGGGHLDPYNESGFGEFNYHYHHGYEAHLHVDGKCPMENGTQNENSNSSSTNSSTSNEKTKAKVEEEAYDTGYYQGYNSLEDNSSSYTGKYKDNYISAYQNGYLDGAEDIKVDKKIAYDEGFELGKTGKPNNVDYPGKVRKKAFDDGYAAGYKKFKEDEIKKYSNLGQKDGKADNDKPSFKNLEKEFLDAYNNAYNKEQEIIKLQFYNEGFDIGIISEEYNPPNFEKERHLLWFKEGYDAGKARLEELKEESYRLGYKGKEYSIPEDAIKADGICREKYKEGKVDKRDGIMNTIVILVLLVTAIIGGIVYSLNSRGVFKRIKISRGK